MSDRTDPAWVFEERRRVGFEPIATSEISLEGGGTAVMDHEQVTLYRGERIHSVQDPTPLPALHRYRLYLEAGHTIEVTAPVDDPPPSRSDFWDHWIEASQSLTRNLVVGLGQEWLDQRGIIVEKSSVIAVTQING